MSDSSQYLDEEACAQAWLAWYAERGFVPLRPLGDVLGRADRYYTNGQIAVAVEITRVLNPVRQEMERFARHFVEREISPLLDGKLPHKLFAEIRPPWRMSQSRRRVLALKVAAGVLAAAGNLGPDRAYTVRRGH